MIRIAIVLIRNRAGDYFVHRRLASKRVFPGLWGLGAGGRIEPHETPEAGAARELFEEAGLATSLSPVAAFPFESGGVRYMVHCYATEAEGPIPNHDPEWSSSRFVSEQELDGLVADGQLCPDTTECLRRYRAQIGS